MILTISEPAAASSIDCAAVARTSAVSVIVIDWTTIGAPPPTWTWPTFTPTVLWSFTRGMDSRSLTTTRRVGAFGASVVIHLILPRPPARQSGGTASARPRDNVAHHRLRDAAAFHDTIGTVTLGTLLLAASIYGTLGFYALGAVALLGAVAAAYRLLLRRAQAREAELIRLVEERTSQLQQANNHLQRLSYIDSLTGIANRRHFEEILEVEWRRAVRAGTPMTLLMLDIDNFKLYNDTFGHRAGDGCLVRVATILDQSVQRAGDLLARYGGEEFAAVLTRTDEAGGIEVAERLRAGVETLAITLSDDPIQVVTISIGVAAGIPAQASSHEALLRAADKALYAAKRAGRNRVGIASSPLVSDPINPPAERRPAI